MIRKWIRIAVWWISMLWMLNGYAAPAFQPFGPDGMERIVASQKGKSFVLVIWSLDCAYCQASLTTLAQEKGKHKNLRIVTLTTDSLADAEAVPLMMKKLEAAGMAGNAWAFGTAPAEQLRYAVDPKWRGELPRSYWFNAQGKSVAYSGVITPEVIAKFTTLQLEK